MPYASDDFTATGDFKMRNVFDNGPYPPGVTDREIDENFGSAPDCEKCGGSGFVRDGSYCVECPVCHGTGLATETDDGDDE